MRSSDLKSQKRNKRLVRRCLALVIGLSTFMSLGLPNYGVLPRVSAENDAVLPYAKTDDDPIAWFDFDDSSDRLKDRSGNNVRAELVNGDDITGAGGNNSYLDLTGSDAYLSLEGNLLKGLTEMTVEMQVKTNNAAGPNWAFFAAPDDRIPDSVKLASDEWDHREHYLGVLLNSNVTVERYANNGKRPTNPVTGWTADNEWHTIRIVFKISSTILCVDDEVKEIGTPYSLSKCVGENDVLWFGRSAWVDGNGNNEGFDGCIDNIKIWDHAIYDPINEDEYIITDRVTDPKYTTVNMFDYWITEQNANDYSALEGTNHNTLLQGINKDHLFLFAGETAFNGGPLSQATAEEIGFWNRSTGSLGANGELITTNMITQGIIQRTLNNGYPVLALDAPAFSGFAPSNLTLKALWDGGSKKTESLAYLFDPNKAEAGKASYPDVTGLFRINDQGYYEFRSWSTFAELNAEQGNGSKTSTSNNHITLYDKIWGWGLPNEHDGQFFPFNDWSDMFFEGPSGLEQAHKNDTANSVEGGSGQTTTDEPLNHYFGMTVETEFQQPVNGLLDRGTTSEAMKFEFSGDDDIWIFIDDVLVVDLGGIHGWKTISIDFSTGKIVLSNDKDGLDIIPPPITLYDMFRAAGKETSVGWKDITDPLTGDEYTLFSDNSVHTLKFFYLERGNQFSNCNITFNLREPIVDHIRKVDENGDPLSGATFKLYEASENSNFNINKQWHTADEFDIGALMTSTTSGEDGYALLITEKGEALQYANSRYYILEETGTPVGYRKNPRIVLEYHHNTNTFTVVNKYETGAYASFLADWAQPPVGADVEDKLEKGLAVIVPVVKIGSQRLPMYGSNTYGWNTVTPNSGSESDFIKALTAAAFIQAADPVTQDWYLRWDDVEKRLKGQIDNLPGDATRYGAGGDIELVTLLLPGDALKAVGLDNDNCGDDNARYAALRAALKDKDAKTLVATLSGIELLNTNNFVKTDRTVIYVPNEQRELRLRKVDENGEPIGGAVFALFDTSDNAAAGKTTTSDGVLAYGTTGDNGGLIFRANGLMIREDGYGYAKMDWDSDRTGNATAVYWLKEIAAPDGYELNTSLIRIEVGNAGIYANATGFDTEGKLLVGDAAESDGIKVEASLGKLTQTLVKYAEGIVDETLTHITAAKQTADSSNGALDINSWRDVGGESTDLIYDRADGYDPVTFTAENGYIRVMPRQNKNISNNTAKRDILTDIDLGGLFGLINTVVVTDPKIPETGGLTVSKTVEVPDGEAIDTEEEFRFTVTLDDSGFNNAFSFEGGNTIEFVNGTAEFTLRHGESVTFAELPAGAAYTVTEAETEGYTVSSTGASGTIAANDVVKAEFVNTMIADPGNYPGQSDEPNKPNKPNEPGAPDVPDDNPETGIDTRLCLWIIAVMLSVIAAVNPFIKRGKHRR